MNQYLRLPSVKEATGLSRSTIWRLEEKGEFPKRRKLSKQSVGWLKSDLDSWIASRSHVGQQETK